MNVRSFLRLTPMLLTLASAGAYGQVNLIARLHPGANPALIAYQYGIQYKEKAPAAPFYLFFVRAGLDPEAIQLQMATNPNVAWVEDDLKLESPEGVSGGKGGTVGAINDRNNGYALNAGVFNQIGFYKPFTLQWGRPVRIALLDTGLAPNLTSLWSRAVARYNAVEPGTLPLDVARRTDSNLNGKYDEGVGHGTFVAGLIDQISPKSLLVIARVADSDGVSSAWRLIKGLSYSVAVGAEVANISLGSPGNVPALSDVIEWAQLNGTLVIAAAGNENRDMVYDPAGISKVLAVTGVDGADRKAVFSNFHGKIESCAPATGLRSYGIGPNMVIWSGTSFAAPLVSGAVIECLRHLPAKMSVEVLFDRVEASGMNIDALNPGYQGHLGRRLWLPDLWLKIKG